MYFGYNRIAFKSFLDLFFHPLIKFKIEVKILTTAVFYVSRTGSFRSCSGWGKALSGRLSGGGRRKF